MRIGAFSDQWEQSDLQPAWRSVRIEPHPQVQQGKEKACREGRILFTCYIIQLEGPWSRAEQTERLDERLQKAAMMIRRTWSQVGKTLHRVQVAFEHAAVRQ